MSKITEKEFKQWLDSINCHPLLVEKKSGKNTIYFKVPSDKDCYYLYKQDCYEKTVPNRALGFDYTGIYSIKQGLIYDEDWGFRETYPNLVNELDIMGIKEDITKGVKAYVENYIGNDRSRLGLKELSPKQQEKYKMFTDRVFEAEARAYFLNGESLRNTQYQCDYSFYDWKADADILDYINDAEAFIKKEGEKYLQERQENILWNFMRLDRIKTELAKLEETGDTPLRRQRNIIQAMRQTEGKTVQVTVEKDGQSCAFKYDTQSFRIARGNYYSISGMPRQDRGEYTQRFNGEGSFKPEDIVDISYRGKSIYSAEPYIPEQDQSPVQSM